jgi:N-acetylmuramoyl-L-alanine amidase
MYVINGGLLQDVKYKYSPNMAGKLDPKYVVMHFTAGRGFENSVSWLTDPDAEASAHIVIGRKGQIVQLVPFDKQAWHAGKSQWNGLEKMNKYSIGIELDNAGQLRKQGKNWVTWFGTRIPEKEVIVATHKHESAVTGWHAYTEAQIAKSIEVVKSICKYYPIKDILGHEDIAPDRKNDPGPAFPMELFKSAILGRHAD